MATSTLAAQRKPLDRLLTVLRCPECRRGSLSPDAPGALHCADCGRGFPILAGVPYLLEAHALSRVLGAPLTPPRGPAPRTSVGGPHGTAHGALRTALRRAARRAAGGLAGGAYHWREYGIRELLPDAGSGREALLVGCGDAGERPFLEALGFDAVAFDIRASPAIDFVADAHRLPLADAAFDVVISMQVLEHLHSPWIAVEEIGRVLRPGGWFVGSVAFLKPYHRSYFHMTHLGVRHLLRRAGLAPDRFEGAQSLIYSIYGGWIPLGSRSLRRALLGSIDRLVYRTRAALWKATRRADPDAPTRRYDDELPFSFRTFDRLRYAPAVVFRAHKEPADMTGPTVRPRAPGVKGAGG